MLGNASLESDGQGRWSCPLCVPLLSHSLPGAERELDAALAVQASVNVVQVYGFCFDAPDARIRIVTEHCSHGTLREHVKELPQVCGRRCVALQTHSKPTCISSTWYRAVVFCCTSSRWHTRRTSVPN